MEPSKNINLCKTPKGTRDFGPIDVLFRRNIIEKIQNIFETYGGQPIDTPVIECLETVKNLYGDEFNKQVYALNDDSEENPEEDKKQATEKLILRYDLTVPNARYIANNGIVLFRRYQIGKVYRKDNPQICKGRYREFYQCDFDIIGNNATDTKGNNNLLHETEILNLLNTVLNEFLNVNTFKIIINDRKILFDILKSCNVENDKLLPVCSTIDKFNDVFIKHDTIFAKESEKLTNYFDELFNELVLKTDSKVAKDIISCVEIIVNTENNPFNILETLFVNKYITELVYTSFKMQLTMLQEFPNVYSNIIFSPFLSRGLDYYTGLIFEATYNNKLIMPSSIAAGGRYDNMLEKLGNKGKISAIGMSIGLERIITILEKTIVKPEPKPPKVFVASVGKNMELSKLKILTILRENKIHAEMSYTNDLKMRNQLDHVFEKKIPYMIIVGETEIQKKTVQFKNISFKTQIEMKLEDCINYLKSV